MRGLPRLRSTSSYKCLFNSDPPISNKLLQTPTASHYNCSDHSVDIKALDDQQLILNSLMSSSLTLSPVDLGFWISHRRGANYRREIDFRVVCFFIIGPYHIKGSSHFTFADHKNTFLKASYNSRFKWMESIPSITGVNVCFMLIFSF